MSILKIYKLQKNDPSVVETVEALIETVAVLLPLGRLYAFGSFVHDTMTAESDLDMALVVPDDVDTKSLRTSILKSLPRNRMPLDFLVMKNSYFEEQAKTGGVCFDILTDGILLFPR